MANASLNEPQISRLTRRTDAPQQRLVGVRAFSVRNILAYVFLAVVTVYFLTPLYWLAIASTKNNTDLFNSFGLWIAQFNLWQNLHDTFTYGNGEYIHWIFNTVLYAVVGG